MVSLVISGIAVIGIYQGFTSITNTNEVHEQVIEMHQNLRVGLQLMTRELRMAGYDPRYLAGAGFLPTSNSTQADFTMDLDGDGFIETTVSYRYDNINNELDRIETITGNAPVNTSVIQNVDALNFVYLDSLGVVTNNPALISSVQVSLVERTSDSDFTYTNNEQYFNLQGPPAIFTASDNFHRRLLTTEVKCRNMGLK